MYLLLVRWELAENRKKKIVEILALLYFHVSSKMFCNHTPYNESHLPTVTYTRRTDAKH
jgi:hypothetical protein